MTLDVYKEAEIYSIAFSFINPKSQVDRFEQYIAEHSHIPVHRVLDVCCGPAVELREFARRDYSGIGLDISSEMLAYLKQKGDEENVVFDTVQADMRSFELPQPVDFAYIMVGSIIYVADTKGLLAHLSCMSKALNKGGLYLIENLDINWTNPKLWQPVTWTLEQNGISVQTTFQLELVNALEQTVYHKLSYLVNDRGVKREIKSKALVKLFFPQEFKTIVEMQGYFEVVGFFERDSTRPIHDVKSDNIVLLRKK
jgi:SAM-dependent methyltransferase